MSTLTAETPIDTLAQLVERLGRIPLERIRLHPYPGTATEEDVLRIEQVTVYTGPEANMVYGPGDTLDGQPVLTGFCLELDRLFAELDRRSDA